MEICCGNEIACVLFQEVLQSYTGHAFVAATV